ncbi:MAG TPA: riboflavin synthase, partial [Planctomycetaceae bacterium]|nr:riboflavin synthase [Planctomycetaceae bacterium]
DGTAEVVDVRQNGEWTDLWFRPAVAQHRLLVPKGSVAVDGVSLTVVSTADGLFSVALIPHTLAVTTLGRLQRGDQVNIENDVLGKYVDHLLASRLAGLVLPTQESTAPQ